MGELESEIDKNTQLIRLFIRQTASPDHKGLAFLHSASVTAVIARLPGPVTTRAWPAFRAVIPDYQGHLVRFDGRTEGQSRVIHSR